jgi:hypothetical protein
MESIADDDDCSKSTVATPSPGANTPSPPMVVFSYPVKQPSEIKTVAIDMMEHPIERPKENQEEWCSGKNRHTVKSQIIADRETYLIDDVEAKGSARDFRCARPGC